MKILIAKDDSLTLKTVELKLKKDGFEVITCIDGKIALTKLRETHPDIILTDILLPYFSGLEIIKASKSIGKQIPIIVFSTLGQEEMVKEAFILGANDFVKKPFYLTELSVRIQKIVGNTIKNN